MFPDRVAGVHLNSVPLQRPHQAVDGEQLEDWERRGIERGEDFIARGHAYDMLNSTVPCVRLALPR